jgi:hypothetical protein
MTVEHPEIVDVQAPPRPSDSRTVADPGTWKEALELWLRWNECYEHVSAEAFAAGGDQRCLEDLMDEMDRVRQQALDLSRRLLAGS